MSAPTPNQPGDEASASSPDPEAANLRHDIERTRADMSATLGALEEKLNPTELRQKAVVELHNVEEKVKEAVREQVQEARVLIKSDLAQAEEHVKQELAVAYRHAKQSVRKATLGRVEDVATRAGDAMNDTRDTLVDTIRDNPLPAALAGVGLVWLLMNRSNASRRRRTEHRRFEPSTAHSFADAERAAGRMFGRVGEKLGNVAHGATDATASAVHGITDAAANLAHQAGDTAGSIAHQAGEVASHLAHDARDAADHMAHQAGDVGTSLVHGAEQIGSDLAHRAQDTAGFLSDNARRQARENPLAIAAAVVVVGAAIGYAMPRTHREDALMGETRDRLVHQAGEAAKQAVESVHHLADKTVETAKTAVHDAARS
jgi:uncharacterized protein DUF3618